jgi:hypothetical protein
LEDLGTDGRIILERNLNKYDDMAWSGFILNKRERRGGLFEHCNEPSGFIKSKNSTLESVSFSKRTLLHGVN